MSKLFKVKPAEKKHTGRIDIKLFASDVEIIRASAKARNLSVSEFIRRAAMGRRADVVFETEIVLALRDVVMVIRAWHAALVEQGLTPPEEHLGVIVDMALETMLKIER